MTDLPVLCPGNEPTVPGILLANMAATRLAADVKAEATALPVAHIGAAPDLSTGRFAYAVLRDAQAHAEVVKVMAVESSPAAFVVERAQDQSLARAWKAGDLLEFRLTRGAVSQLILDAVNRTLAATCSMLGFAEPYVFEQCRDRINAIVAAAMPVGGVDFCFSDAVADFGEDFSELDGGYLRVSEAADLFAVWGYRFGSAEDGALFRKPDLRGRYLRVCDNGAEIDPDAADREGGDAPGSTQEDAYGEHNHLLDMGFQWIAEGGDWAWGDREHGEGFNTTLLQATGGNQTSFRDVSLTAVVRVHQPQASQPATMLTVSVQPAGIGARWRYDGGEWRRPGTIALPAGEYEVEFEAVAGYAKPDSRRVAVQGVTAVVVRYLLQVQLTVIAYPTGIGGKWRFVGEEAWRDPGTASELEGSRTIEFKGLTAYKTPSPVDVVLSQPSASVFGSYVAYPRYNQPRMLVDQWTMESNSSMSACVVSTGEKDLKAFLVFRGSSDYAGLGFSSKDNDWHTLVCYPESHDYSGYKITFDAIFSGEVANFNDLNQKPALSIVMDDGAERYVSLGFLSMTGSASDAFENYNYSSGTHTFLSHKWIKWSSETVRHTIYGATRTLSQGEYYIDYVNGWVEAYVEDGGTLQVDYEYGLQQHYVIDFDNLWEGEHPSSAAQVSASGINRVTIPLMYRGFIKAGLEGANRILAQRQEANVVFQNFMASRNGAELAESPIGRTDAGLQLADGYDDQYHRNPSRLIKALYGLGYGGRLTIYTGASHFYERTGTPGDPAAELVDDVWTQRWTVDPSVGLNTAAREWWRYLLRAAKNRFDQVVCSISLENLHIPQDWSQVAADGHQGQTGWVPPTRFYSPTNAAVRTYVTGYCREFLDIMVSEGFPPFLQMGEPWWWIQEAEPGGGYGASGSSGWWDTKPPCFYDAATRATYAAEHIHGDGYAVGIPGAGYVQYAAEANGVFVFLSAFPSCLFVSTNLSDFTQVANPFLSLGKTNLNHVASDGERFVAVGSYGHISISTDGLNWSDPILVGVVNNDYWGNSITYVHGSWFFEIVNHGIYKSEDLSTWTKVRTGGFNAKSICYGNGYYFLQGWDGNYRSEDGSNWTKVSTSPYAGSGVNGVYHGLAFGNGTLVGVFGAGTTPKAYTSQDGASWRYLCDLSGYGWDVTFILGYFYAVFNSTSSYGPTTACYRFDEKGFFEDIHVPTFTDTTHYSATLCGDTIFIGTAAPRVGVLDTPQLPEWTAVSAIEDTFENRAVAEWLQAKLADYCNFVRSIVKSYSGGLFACLFFPPSVLDPNRMPWISRVVNYPRAAFLSPNCDTFQLEDYDWVMYPTQDNRPLHEQVFTFAQESLGYNASDVDYFIGFAWKDNIEVYWDRIRRAVFQSRPYGVNRTIWAGVEILRDSWAL